MNLTGEIIHDTATLDDDTAREMCAVGIVPSDTQDQIGYRFKIGTQAVAVIGYATKSEFLDAVAACGLPRADFAACPLPYYLKISTD